MVLSFESLYFVPLLPLIGAALLGLFGSRMDKGLVATIALGSVLGSFVIVCIGTWHLSFSGHPFQPATWTSRGGTIALEDHLWTWIEAGRYRIDLTLGLDALSSTLMLVVTGVGFL